MIRNGMRRKLAYQQAQQEQAQVTEQLEQRWSVYPAVVQKMLAQHLDHHGLNSAQSTTTILEQFSQFDSLKKE